MVATRFVEALHAPRHDEEGNEIKIGVSIGMAYYPIDGEDLEVLLEGADAALYKAKEAGKGRFAWFSTPPRVVLDESPLAADRQTARPI